VITTITQTFDQVLSGIQFVNILPLLCFNSPSKMPSVLLH
jgi:hypothetical protein